MTASPEGEIRGDDMKENKFEDRKECNLYVDAGNIYLFQRDELITAFHKARKEKGISAEKMRAEMEQKTGIPEATICNHLRTDIHANFPKEITVIKKYGKVLAGNKNAFLHEVKVSEIHPDDRRGDIYKTVFGMLYDLLACYEASGGFNYIPGTDDSDGAWSHFETEIGRVKKELMTKFFDQCGNKDCQKLERIINETEAFIKSYSVPGVAKRWRKINPQINYFDCVFEIIRGCGMETARQLYGEGLLDYLPCDYIIKAQKVYFAQREYANLRNNLQYSEERLFQNELLRTLAMVFDNDFNNNYDADNTWFT